MSKLLINENPLLVLPSLVLEMNGNIVKAMLIQQIHWLCNQPRSGIDHDGHHWIWKTSEEWVEDHFTWLSSQTIRKYLVALEDEGHIVSATRIQYKWDNTKYYRLSSSWYSDDAPNRYSTTGSKENSHTASYTETTTETTKTETTTDVMSSDDDDPKPLTDWQLFMKSFTQICLGHNDWDTIPDKTIGMLRSNGSKIYKKGQGYTVDELENWYTHHWLKQWPGNKPGNEHPSPSKVRELIPQVRTVKKNTDSPEAFWEMVDAMEIGAAA